MLECFLLESGEMTAHIASCEAWLSDADCDVALEELLTSEILRALDAAGQETSTER